MPERLAANTVTTLPTNVDRPVRRPGFTFDSPLGRRIQQTPAGGTTRSFFYSDQWQVIEEREGGVVKATNAWSPALYVDALVYRDRDTDSNGSLDERIYPLHDANFNVTALTNSSGTVIERFIYDPYGSVTVLDANWAADADGQSDVGWVYLHQGGRFDWTTGLYHFRMRDYDSTLGRWVQQDPARFIDGVNFYQHLRSNPTVLNDPIGLAPNRKDAVDSSWLLRRAKEIESQDATLTPCEVLRKLQERFDGAPKYIYTTKNGWMDLNHFFHAAVWTQRIGSSATLGFGVLVEFVQGILGVGLPFLPGQGSSAFNSEDFPSNSMGIQFGWSCCGATPLSAQLQSYLERVGATDPRLAPDWTTLPANEQEHERDFREAVKKRTFLTPMGIYF